MLKRDSVFGRPPAAYCRLFLFPSGRFPRRLLSGKSQKAHETEDVAVKNGSARILVVEDDNDLCSLMCDLLCLEGYRAQAGADGLDVMLPGLDGFEVCQQLKFRRDTNLIPILMLTALDDRETRERGLRV